MTYVHLDYSVRTDNTVDSCIGMCMWCVYYIYVVYIHTYMHIYIHIYCLHVYIYIYIYIYVHIVCIPPEYMCGAPRLIGALHAYCWHRGLVYLFIRYVEVCTAYI